MFKTIAFIIGSVAWAGSAFIPAAGQAPATVPIGGVIEYALDVLPAGDNYLWADGDCVSSAAYPIFAAGVSNNLGFCPAGMVAKPDRRGNIARGWVPQNIRAIQSSGTVTSNAVLATGHGFRTGMKVRITSGTLTGLSTGTDYYAIVDRTISPDHIAFATTRNNASNGTKIAISGTASAIIAQWESPDENLRISYSLNAANSGIGGLQTDELRSHTHAGSNNGNGYQQGGNGGNAYTVLYGVVGYTGGNETRPSNVAMGYIVRVK